MTRAAPYIATLAAMASMAAQTSQIKHRFVQVNGIKMHIAEQGGGPLVVLVHGFPDYWATWKPLMKTLAAAGYRTAN